MEDQVIIKNSVRKIFGECGFDDASKMTQRDFEFVSTKIEEKTGIVLSSTTLKRLANGEFSRLPQVATLNAIARYLGAENWTSYSKQPLSRQTETGPSRNIPAPRRAIVISLVALAVVLMAFFITRNRDRRINFDNVTFSATKTTNNDMPNTVVFNYNVDDVDADSFFIQQSWDDNRRVRVYKNQYTLTDIYYEPGFHLAKLIANDSMIREIEVSIPTDRWMFYANEQKILYKTEYINGVELSKGTLTLSEEDLARNDIDTKEDKFYIYSYFPTKMDASADNFDLKARVRMKDVKNSLCPFIELEVFCQRGYHIIKAHDRVVHRSRS